MKRLIIMSTLALFALGAVYGQEAADLALLARIGVSGEVREKATALYKAAAEKTEALRADLRIKEAELSKLLLPDDYDLAAVEKKLREISNLEVEVRMIRIRNEMELRELIGKERWARFRQAVRNRMEAAAAERAKQAERDPKKTK